MDERPMDPDDATRPHRARQRSVPTKKPATFDESLSASSFDDSRFTPGTLLAGRYRVVGKLGKGGMGEVYRADDLKLGQAVALKFLPESFIHDPKWLRRFNDEVRIARDVAHPNVCRTYDIVEAEGEHFITMEYVDGEDLSSLLLRIGRLPQDKAIEISRQLCAGLAAAHDKGVLHRDLKPANVMLDGRGRVRITDFGIAALAEELHGKAVRSGTPAYMAPEQLKDGVTSIRSDIYSLGLVLYEVFTGREAYRAESLAQLEHMRKTGSPATPSTIVHDIDPLVERVIMRCLEVDPRDRPTSAIAVAAALPGGDPLAMALAAGETPSPEMVAQAGEFGALKPGWAVAGLALTLVCALVANIVLERLGIRRLLPFEKPPAALIDRAREVEKKLGFVDTPGDWEIDWNVNWTQWEYWKGLGPEDQVRDKFTSGRLGLVGLWYVTSPQKLVPRNERGRVEGQDPPLLTAGMRYLTVDLQGRLLWMAMMGEEYDKAAAGAATQPAKDAATSSAEPDWSLLFEAAGIDMAAFTPATPLWIPRVPFDRHVAWTGAFPEHPDVPMRIEAASLRGKFVSFGEYGPWQKTPGAVGSEESATIQKTIDTILFPILIVVVLASATVLAWRNVRAGRGDRRGAWRLALFLVAVTLLAWVFTAHHVGGQQELEMFLRALASSFGSGVAGWIMYLAFEPFARRYWPQSIISWTRLLSGRWRDPLVGRNVLQGALAGASIAMITSVPGLIAYLSNSPKYHSDLTIPPLMLGPRYAIGNAIGMLAAPTLFMGMFVLILLLRIALRKQWLAMLVMALLLLVLMMAPAFSEKDGANWYGAASGFVLSIGLLFCLVYLGVLATLTMMIVSIACWSHPFTTDFSNWYAGLGLTGMVMIAAIAGYGFWIALAGQPLLKDELQG